MTDPRELLGAYAHDWLGDRDIGYREDFAEKAFAALRAVLDLHKSFQYGDESNEDDFVDPNVQWCRECTLDSWHRQQWPCPTVQAIVRELEGK